MGEIYSGRYYGDPPALSEAQRVCREINEARADVKRTKAAYASANFRYERALNMECEYNKREDQRVLALRQEKCSCPPRCASCGKKK